MKLLIIIALTGLIACTIAQAGPIDLEDDFTVDAVNKKKPETFEYQPEKNPASADDDDGSKAAEENIKTIAFNSREMRLMGPNQKEVEMKEDAGTKMMIALDNLGKEASEVWGQVNDKLDKGWTELKKMIDGVVSPKAPSSKVNIYPY